ncbi:MAG: DUF1587 domain-containing protein, partial [Verrucomicrobiota bacterium]
MRTILMAFLVSAAVCHASDPARPFLEEHCFKCHGAEEQKGDLRFDRLTSSEKDVWLSIADVLEAGDMPPKKEPTPEPKEIDALLDWIARTFAGPTPLALRRMNRAEYENTVQDLLGIDTPLAELLPEDSSVQGFDNVADGLSISSILIERYLEAANTAFDGVVRRIKPLPAETRRVEMMENKENIEAVKKKKGGVIEVDDSFVKFTPGWPPARLDAVHPIEDGVYRCRIAVWPHEPSQRTLTMAVFVGPLFGPGKRRFMGMYDATGTAEDPRVIEFTARMKENDALHLVPWVYPGHVTWRDKHEPRPGIGIVWAETHGPLDQSFPSTAQKTLFGTPESIFMKDGKPIRTRLVLIPPCHVPGIDPGHQMQGIVFLHPG